KSWLDDPNHQRWLRQEADSLFAFFEVDSLDPAGGFFALDTFGRIIPTEAERPVHATSRIVHCYAVGSLLRRPRAAGIVYHGMAALLKRHRDLQHGGYFNSFDADGPRDTTKLAYGHAFVLLAGASAKVAGHPDADKLIADVSEVLESRYWDDVQGASKEEYL